jgi:hypothetical protein
MIDVIGLELLWVHRDVTGPATEVGTVLAVNGLKAVRDTLNDWHGIALALRQASHPGLATLRAPQSFVPLIGHPTI